MADFPNSKHKCLCPADFTGQHCEKEMGEIIMPFKFKAVIRFDTIQDAILTCVESRHELMSQLNLPHGIDNLNV